MKRNLMLTGVICASLLISAYAASPVAEDTAPAAAVSEAPTAEALPYSIGVRAVVTDILKDDGQISLEVKPEDGEPIILHLSDATVLVDNQNAIPVGAEDIQVGDTIQAYHSTIMTMSIPGQTPALAILTNLGDGAVAALHTPEQVTRDGENAAALCDNGSIWIRTAAETEFTPYRTRQRVTAADLRMGQPFLAWYEAVAESYPAQTTASRIMILPDSGEEAAPSLILDGDMVIDAKTADGTLMVPARLTGETLGLTVGYRREGSTAFVTLSDASGELSMTLGEDLYRFRAADGKDAEPVSLGAAPDTAPYMDGAAVTWMPAEAFRMFGYEVSLVHGVLSIQK